MRPIQLAQTLLASAVIAGAVPAIASAHNACHDRPVHHAAYRVPSHYQGRHHARVVVHTRTIVVHDVRTVYVREPARIVYVQPRPVVYRRDQAWGYYDRPRHHHYGYPRAHHWRHDGGRW